MTRQFEIYYHNLNTEAKAELLSEFDTKPDEENWESIPLAIIEREDENIEEDDEVFKHVDRVEEWQAFSEHMEEYIRERTVQKYSMNSGLGVDLMSFTELSVCIWSILKYAIRLHNGKGKEHDIQKIAHYSCFAFSKQNQ
ncbi:hypothetical protein ACFL67_02910 [candidate division KSB1 bacterium]